MNLTYDEYDEDTLKQLQQVELNMMIELDRFCEENEIVYFGNGGTALGAVRHGGFIPWDDDIDIAMTRENYDRFISLADRLEDRYTIISHKTTPSFPLMTTRISLKGTEFVEECFKDLDLEQGIFIDLYCMDNVFDNPVKRKLQVLSVWIYSKIIILWFIDNPVLYYNGLIEKIIQRGCKLFHVILKWLYKTPDGLFDRAEKITCMANNKHTKRVGFFPTQHSYGWIMEREEAENIKRYEFEGYMLAFPSDIHKYLLEEYGEGYMELPPVEKRHNHPPYKLTFPVEE